MWSNVVRRCVVITPIDRLRNTRKCELSEEKLVIFADTVAENMADEVRYKVNTKCGELVDGKIVHIGGASFRITGTKNGKEVLIEQHQIINVSCKGKLFNQYPARIYVNGSFVSAASFRKI